jgi:hypothetical protein
VKRRPPGRLFLCIHESSPTGAGNRIRIDLDKLNFYNVFQGGKYAALPLWKKEESPMRTKVLPGLGAAACFLLFTLMNGSVFDLMGYGRYCRDTGLFGPPSAYAGQQDEGPYGVSGGGTYGQKQQVGTKDDARKLLKEYFSKKDVTIGEIREKQYYFEADIKNRNGKLVDKVIVDKRTGRIRSIY